MNLNETIDERLKAIETLLLSQKTVLSFDEMAIYTGLSKSHLYKLTSSGGVPCYKPKGKHIFFSKSEVDQWLLQNRKATTEEIEAKVSAQSIFKNIVK
ncbi:MAG: DNA-binding protein [Spirochaetes bacterium]|nr:MAG: DNA-binding protein [Spirochaetota bacterium]